MESISISHDDKVRMDKMKQRPYGAHKEEPFSAVVHRALDFWDAGHKS